MLGKEVDISGSGSGVPNERLRVYGLFQLSTTWSRNFGMSVDTVLEAMTYFKHNETSTVG